MSNSPDIKLTKEMVLNQLMENSRMLDSRLAEDDFPLPPPSRRQSLVEEKEKEEVLLLDIPFMLLSFLLSQVEFHFQSNFQF